MVAFFFSFTNVWLRRGGTTFFKLESFIRVFCIYVVSILPIINHDRVSVNQFAEDVQSVGFQHFHAEHIVLELIVCVIVRDFRSLAARFTLSAVEEVLVVLVSCCPTACWHIDS